MICCAILSTERIKNEPTRNTCQFIRGSSTDSEADGGVALEGFFEAFVETVIDGLGCRYNARKKEIADDNLPVLKT